MSITFQVDHISPERKSSLMALGIYNCKLTQMHYLVNLNTENEMTNFHEDEFLKALAAADELGMDKVDLQKIDFCQLYRDKLRSVLGLAIAIVSIFRPSVAEGLKLIRDRLDDLCPA